MNFQDIVDKNSEQVQLLRTLNEFKNSIVHAKTICDQLHNYLFINCYKNVINGINNYMISQHNVLRESLISIDGYDLKYTINKIKDIYNNYTINSLLDVIENNYKEIMRMRKITDTSK